MADFDSVLTDAGRALIAQCLAKCKPLKITGAAVGSGRAAPGTPLAALTQLVAPVNGAKALFADSKYISEAQCAVVVQVTNGERAEGFSITEVGVYAENLEGGQTLLLYLSVYDHPDYMQPLRDGVPVTVREYTAVLRIENDWLGVVVKLAPAALVARETLDDAILNHRHPMSAVDELIADQNRQDADIAAINARIAAAVTGGTEIWVGFDDDADWAMTDGVWDQKTAVIRG